MYAEDELKKINKHLHKILSKEMGYFGCVFTWHQRDTDYEYIGYELTDDFYSTLTTLPTEKIRNLVDIMNYFEIHANPLKKLLPVKSEVHDPYEYYSKIAWSHFMITVMFGMLEVAVKGERKRKLNGKGYAIKLFLCNNLPEDTKKSIHKRYKVDKDFEYNKKIENFSDVVDHLWSEIRSGFIHDNGFESIGLEWNFLTGLGTKDDPLVFHENVPVAEFLQITWQAILNSFGYTGKLK